ncbi:MAG: M2 family metallopeptidase, partial [Oricola sp.]|nr:M2 family metallopeptidase [Oricola sp.]
MRIKALRPFGALAAVSALALIAACSESPAEPSANAEPTVADAEEFIGRVEDWMRDFGEYSARIDWVNATYITHDTDWLSSRVAAEGVEKGVEFANEAKRFNDLELPADMRRKIELIKLGVNLPAPEKPGAARELAKVNTRMASTYSTGKAEIDGKMVPGVDLEEMMGTVRDPAKLQEMWVKWREITI